MTVMPSHRRYYVTGASGFLGRRVCEHLANFGEVRALFRSPAEGPWRRADLCDLAAGPVSAEGFTDVDTVIHLAARTHAVDEYGDTERLYREINVDGTRRVLEAAANAGVRRVVFVSSVKAMGEGGPEAQDEASTPAPATWYGRTKRDAEILVLDGGYVPEPVVLRPALMYGPGVKGNVSRMIAAVRAGRFPPVPEVGNRRSMVHVEDAASAVALAANESRAAGRIFLVTDGRPYSTREMFERICEALGKSPPSWTVPVAVLGVMARFGDAVGRIRGKRWLFDSDAYDKLFASALYDSSAIETTLGFKPQWTFETALPELIDSQ